MNPAYLPDFAPQPVGAADPPSAGEENLSATQQAARSGQLRSTDGGIDRHDGLYPTPVPQQGSGYEFQQIPGVVTRPTNHPTPLLLTHDVDGTQGGATGVHGEIIQTASTPSGEQTPFGSAPKTWRAEPAPWDQDAYAGWTATTTEGDA